MELFRCSDVGLASEDGHVGHRGYVTDLLERMLAGDQARSAAVYSCGPPAMLEAVRQMCAERGTPCELALESPMACGFGACFGCAVPLADGGYMRLCVDGPVVRGDQIETAMPGRIGPPMMGPVEFCGISLAHPIVNGSGTFDAIAAQRVFGPDLVERFPFSAFVSKTITPSPRPGNPPPRLWEEGAGMINSIGLPNKGLAGFLEHDLPELSKLGVPLIVSVMGTSAEEFTDLIEGVAGRDEVAALELNISCPNVHSGLIVGEQPSETLALMGAIRSLTAKPMIVKLTPNVADPTVIARAAEEGGADAVSLINTIKAAAFDRTTGERWLGAGAGGLSGPAVRTVALKQVADVADAVSIPVVGMGGVESGADARDLILAGATLVAVGSASFRDPLAAERIGAELADLAPVRH